MTLATEVQAELNRALLEVAGQPGGGTNGTFIQRTPGTYSTSTGSVAVTDASYDCIAVEVGAAQQPAEAMNDPLKRRVILSIPSGATPKENDNLTMGGDTYVIVAVQQQVIGGAVSFLCDVRR